MSNTSTATSHLTVAVADTPQADAIARVLVELNATLLRFGQNSEESGSVPLERWILQLVEGEFDDVLFSSAQGVHLMLEVARELEKEKEFLAAIRVTRKIARGSKAASALSDLGVQADITSRGNELSALLASMSRLDLSGHVVGVQPFDKQTELTIAEHIENAGGSVRLVAPSTTVDPEATELLSKLRNKQASAVVFVSERTAAWLFDACRVSGQEQRLIDSLRSIRVIAAESACSFLRRRGVHPDVVLGHTSVLSPTKEEMQRLLGLGEREQSETRPFVKGKHHRVVIVGNGMVGYKLCEQLTDLDKDDQLHITALAEESRPAYDRVHLSDYFAGKTADDLTLEPAEWYAERDIDLRLGERVLRIDRDERLVLTSSGEQVPYDTLVIATGSAPFVPPVPGMDKNGVFVYRTIEDLEAITAFAKNAQRVAVIGGGLLGLEAAKAAKDLGLETHVVEFAPRLMPRQLDPAGARILEREIESLGLHVHLERRTSGVLGEDEVRGLRFADGERIDVDMVIVSAGIRPRDDLAKEAGLVCHERAGILVDDELRTSDPSIFAIGECAIHNGTLYGLVAPGYEMASAVARTILGKPTTFTGADMSTKLKLLGCDVASLGNPFADDGDPAVKSVTYLDHVDRIYKKLTVSPDGKKLLGAILVGDTTQYATLLPLCKRGENLPVSPEELLFGARDGSAPVALGDDAQICSCNNVTRLDIVQAITSDPGCSLDSVKKCTKAGTGCGGCMPLVTDIYNVELAAQGKAVSKGLCEHFEFTRQELFEIIKIRGHRSFKSVITEHGVGHGCEICKPTIASILASVQNDPITEHQTIQDTNDRFLANMQRRGLYSVVPRIPGGEITPDKLIVLGEVAKKYGLYTKITGGQRIDLFGARVEQLPEIWEELVVAGFESGHAYGKAVRTVKSCVGSTWCRYGVQDSVGFAIRVEERYKGIRAPHKLKSAVSGCVRECAEAQSKDFGLIATEKGWNLYVCGNGGAKPRHADLLVADVDEETAIRYIDRFLMYYVKTADKLTRTSVWVDKLEGGIDHVRDVVINDRLGIAKQLEADMQRLVDTYQCEWADVVKNPSKRARFRHFANTDTPDMSYEMVHVRGQTYPRPWESSAAAANSNDERRRLPVVQGEVSSKKWVRVARTTDVPADGGVAIRYGSSQLALFNFASRDEWYACQNMCPHKRDMVLARGIVGDQSGIPKVACPMHKKTFSLESGECLSGDEMSVVTFPVKIEGDEVFLELPSESEVEEILAVESCESNCATDAAQ